ncbi:MAG TPA: 4Fe-4S binding protein, partial [Opitutaceae bacterium]|nr:4Fe-4S binding protein [Opitutaceae bacterium]
WRIEIDQDACRKCGACLKACKAQCIDLRTAEIDASRCVGCFNCVPVCTEGGIGLVWKWHRGAAKAPEAAAPEASAPPADEGRRAFISGSALALTAAAGVAGVVVAEAGRRRRGQGRGPQDQGIVFGPVCPPGSKSVERFLDVCTACHLCVSACPTGVLRPATLEYGWAGLTKPQMDFSKSFCNFDCNRCGEVCPEGAILPLALAEKKTTQLGVARFRRRMCIVHEAGTACGACAEHCPTGAVHMVPFCDGLTIPQVEPEQCIGCGACEYACPVRPARAIRVEALPVHGRAIVVKDKPAESPAPVDDFPF